MTAPKPANRRRPGRLMTFDAYLDRCLEDARVLNETLKKLDRLYDLNSESVLLCEEQQDNPLFDKLTLAAPPIDRRDPLSILRGWTEGEAGPDRSPGHRDDAEGEAP